MKIKVNDKVRVLAGKNKGKEGKVTQVFSTENKVVIEGVNIMKKHMKANKAGQKGQIIELAAPLAVAKVMLLCPKCNRPVRIGYKLEAGKKKRVCRLCQEFID